jgi:hypothetical protein
MLLNYLDGYPETGDEGDIMRVSEFGRWFRFLSVVSLMLCGFSINTWATPSVTVAPAAFVVPAGSDAAGTATFSGAGTSSSSSTVSYIWNYFDGISGTWVNIQPGAGVGIFQGATVTFSPSNTNPQTGVANGTTTTLTIANVPTSASGLQIQLEVTDASSATGTTAYSASVALTVSRTWAADGTLPSGAETFERLTLLANNGPLIAIGGNNPENNAGVTTINVDATPGVTSAPSGPETWTADPQVLPAELVRPTSTLLPNGTVLIAGGLNGVTDSNGSWIYTYGGSGVVNTTGHLATARDAHTASLLPNGLVLVAGGNSNGQILSSTELYNPTFGTWSAGLPMNVARYDHTATTLADGRVLVTGGFNALGAINSAEIYDPIQNTWTIPISSVTQAASAMNVARAYHTATLLPGGDVLIAGGINQLGQPVNSAEIFNPSLGTFTALPGALVTARDQGTATLLANGNVLIAGGFTSAGATAASELFNPTALSSSAAPALITARDADAAVLVPSGDVVAAGGTTAGGGSTATAEKYWDPSAGVAPTPSAGIVIGNNAVAGQYLAATCGAWNGSTYVPQPGVQYAWSVVDGTTHTLPIGTPAGQSAIYPNYTAGAGGIYSGDTSTIEFLIPETESGRTLQLSCLATSSLGIPAQSSVTSPNIAPGVSGGFIPVSNITNNVDGFNPNVTILQGSSVTFSATALGQPTLYDYQWQYYNTAKGWTNWGTAASESIASAITGSDDLQIRVIVTNSVGSQPSVNTQTLYVVAQPQNVVATPAASTITSTQGNPGPNYIYGAPGPVLLSSTYTPITPQVGISGPNANTVTYQWYSAPAAGSGGPGTGGGTLIGGATSKTYSANPNVGGVYYYYVVVTNTLNGVANSVASPTVTVTVNSLPTAVNVQNTITTPAGVVVTPLNSSFTPTLLQGNDITFSAQITGNPYPSTYTYQWQYFNTLVGWKNWGTGATQPFDGVQWYSDFLEVRVAVSNGVGTVYSDSFIVPTEVTVYVVVQPANVNVALTNGTLTPNTSPIAQGNNAVFTATDKAEPGNTTEYEWYEVGNNPIAGGPDLPLNGFVSLSTCDFLSFSPNPIVASTLTIHDACLGDNGTYYAVATNFNTDVSFSNPLITSPTATSNQVPLIVNVGTWSLVTDTPTLNGDRFEAYSLLIPNGAAPTDTDVFYLGGGLQNTSLPPVKDDDIYTPTNLTNGTWTPSGGSTAGEHLDATATLFSDGGAPYVLIAGGSDGAGDGQTGLDIFNTTAQTYSTSNAVLPVPATQQVSAYLPSQSILLAGGQNGDYNTFYNGAYLYTPGATPGTGDTLVASSGVLSAARAGSAKVTLPSGRILITGGQGTNGPVNNVDIYDPWTADYPPAGGNALYPGSLYSVASSNLGVGKAGVAGDFFAQAIWSTNAALLTGRTGHTATLLNDGRVLIAGGQDANGNYLSSLEIWDPTSNSGAGGFYYLGTATPGGSTVPVPTPGTLITPRAHQNAVLLENGDVLIFGGINTTGALSSAEIVNPNWVTPACATQTPIPCATAPTTLHASQPASSLNVARTLASATLLQNGTALAAGGYTGTAGLESTEVFNAEEGFTTPLHASAGTLAPVNYAAGATSAAISFTPFGGNFFDPTAKEIVNYSWSQSDPSTTVLPTGQGTSSFSFNAAAGWTTDVISLQVTDQFGATTLCTVTLTNTSPSWTWSGASCN